MGLDPERLLARAAWMSAQSVEAVPTGRNPGLTLGAVLGEAALAGRDKLTIIADDCLASVGSWLEQLIAESSGKLGFGIVPVDREPLGAAPVYGADRLFVYLRQDGKFDAALAALRNADQPVLVFDIPDPYDLGAEFYRWEFATATACAILGVNAFDQPDVQDAKDRTNAKIAAYKKDGNLAEAQPVWSGDGITVFAPQPARGLNLAGILNTFLGQAISADYVAINAYIPRNPAASELLTRLRVAVRTKTTCATTVGFGPRFQHSTGQLHKGGISGGFFLQITADPAQDIEIPGQGMSFGVLEHAQWLGDYEALAARNRRILRIHLPSPDAIQKLIDLI